MCKKKEGKLKLTYKLAAQKWLLLAVEILKILINHHKPHKKHNL
jgi:hypothetical protein